ncbi:hypothetical protein ABZU32_39175, partial [Sphaerisporangium sp. NPDC005288]|uniref:hypothetical protein n=1 Tax=Sphaerisporangium sp. NPDC005288 TaxID=3155114 RepID=UPI0033B3F4E8
AGPAPGGVLRVSATVRQPSADPLARTADVGAWIRGAPEGHVYEYEKPEERQAALPGTKPVGVGFDASRAPVAQIEARCGDAVAVLPPPFDRPAEIVCDGELTAVTSYLTGGPAYRCAVRAGASGCTLTAADLGLAEVSVDATALRDRGATRVEAEVHYQPSGEGTSERRTIELGDDGWTTSWYVVSRAPGLSGELLVTGLNVTPSTLAAPSFLRSAAPDLVL